MAVPYEFVGPVDALGRVAATVINRLTPEGGKYPLPDYTKPRSTGMPVPVAQKPGQTQQDAQPPVAAVPSVEMPKPVPQVTPTATTQQTNQNAIYKWTDAGGQVNYGNVGAPSGATAMPAVGMPPPDHVAQANEAVQRNLRAAAIYRSMSDDANMHPVTRQAIAYQNAVNMGKADADIAEAAGTYGFGMEKQAAADRAAMERTQASADASIKAHEISAGATRYAADAGVQKTTNQLDKPLKVRQDPVTGEITYATPRQMGYQQYLAKYEMVKHDPTMLKRLNDDARAAGFIK